MANPTPQIEDLSIRLRGVLACLRITTTIQLTECSKEWIATLVGLERTSYRQLIEWEARGMIFKPYNPTDLSAVQQEKLRLILQRLALEERVKVYVTTKRAAKRKRSHKQLNR